MVRIVDRGKNNSVKGYLCVILAALMWASSGTAGKALFDEGMKAFDLVQVRVTLSSILVFLTLLVFSRDLLRIRAKDIPFFVLLGSFAMALVTGSYLYTISKIQVAAAILIQYLAPIFVAIFSMLFWREHPSFYKIAALFLAFGGCYLVVGGYNIELLQMNRLGILGGLTSAITFACYSLLGERAMHRHRPWTVLFYALAFSVPTWHLIYPPFTYLRAGFTLEQWGWIFYISVVGTILPFGLFFAGINHIRSTRASITAILEPIFAGFLALVLLGETLELPQVMGGALVILAIVVLQLQRERDDMAPAMIRREGKANLTNR